MHASGNEVVNPIEGGCGGHARLRLVVRSHIGDRQQIRQSGSVSLCEGECGEIQRGRPPHRMYSTSLKLPAALRKPSQRKTRMLAATRTQLVPIVSERVMRRLRQHRNLDDEFISCNGLPASVIVLGSCIGGRSLLPSRPGRHLH